MPYTYLQIDHYEPSPVASRPGVFARARYRDPVTLSEVTQEFRFSTLAEAQANVQRFAEAYLPVVNGIDALTYLAPPVVQELTKEYLLDAFTNAELKGIIVASKTDDDVFLALEVLRNRGATLRTNQTRQWLTLMVQKGLLTAARRDKIMEGF